MDFLIGLILVSMVHGAPGEVPIGRQLKKTFQKEMKSCDFKSAYQTLKKMKLVDREYYFVNSLSLLKSTLTQKPVDFDRELWRDEVLGNRCNTENSAINLNELPLKPLNTIIQYGILNYGRFSDQSKAIIRLAMYHGLENGMAYPTAFFERLPRKLTAEICELALLAEKSQIKRISFENKTSCEKLSMDELFLKNIRLSLADYHLEKSHGNLARQYYVKLGMELDLTRKSRLALLENIGEYLKVMDGNYVEFEHQAGLVELGRGAIEKMSYLDLKKSLNEFSIKDRIRLMNFYASDAMYFYFSDLLKNQKRYHSKIIDQLMRIAVILKSPSLMARSLEYRKGHSLNSRLIGYLKKWPDQELVKVVLRKRSLKKNQIESLEEALKLDFPKKKLSKISTLPLVNFPSGKIKI